MNDAAPAAPVSTEAPAPAIQAAASTKSSLLSSIVGEFDELSARARALEHAMELSAGKTVDAVIADAKKLFGFVKGEI